MFHIWNKLYFKSTAQGWGANLSVNKFDFILFLTQSYGFKILIYSAWVMWSILYILWCFFACKSPLWKKKTGHYIKYVYQCIGSMELSMKWDIVGHLEWNVYVKIKDLQCHISVWQQLEILPSLQVPHDFKSKTHHKSLLDARQLLDLF